MLTRWLKYNFNIIDYVKSRLVFTLPVLGLGDNIIKHFLAILHPFIFSVIHRNTIYGGWGLTPIYNH